MESTQPTQQVSPASAATALLAATLFDAPPTLALIDSYVQELHDHARQITGSVSIPPLAASSAVAKTAYTSLDGRRDLNLKVLKQIEIATFLLANRDLSIKQVADRFGVTPATISRITGTDGFQYILATEAKNMATQYKSARSQFEGQVQSGALLALERLIDRIQLCNDTDQLLKIVSSFAELLGMGSKGGTSVAINNTNNFGVTGDHLRFAIGQAPRSPATYDTQSALSAAA